MLDSLMAIELRNNLSQGLQFRNALPATLIFDHPSIADMATYLLALWRADRGAASKDRTEPAPTAPPPSSSAGQSKMTAAVLDRLTDAEVEQLLHDKLERM
jgi:hypothetical protein